MTDSPTTGGSAASPPHNTAQPRVHVLRERNMRWYFGTQLVSLTGSMIQSSLLSLLIIDLVGAKKAPPLVGMVWALNVLPGAFLSPFAGIFVDRTNKRRVLQITALLGAAAASALGYWTYMDVHHVAMWKIMGVTLATGFINTVDSVGRNAIVKDAVIHKDNHGIGGIIFNSLYTVGMVLGNGLAGFLVLSVGYASSFGLNALSYLVLIVGLSQMDFSHLPPKNNSNIWEGMWSSVKENMHYSLTNTGIRLCILLSMWIMLFGFSYNVIMSIIAKVMFAGGPKEYSYLAGASGLGSLVGSIVSIIWSERRPKTLLVGGCFIIGIALIAFANATNLDYAAVLVFCCGFGFMTGFGPIRGVLMHIVPQERIGSVLGITFMFFYGAMVISSIGAGFMAKHVGCPLVLEISGVCLIGTALAGPFLAVPKMGKTA